MTDKGLMSQTYKELIQLNSENHQEKKKKVRGVPGSSAVKNPLVSAGDARSNKPMPHKDGAVLQSSGAASARPTCGPAEAHRS